MKKWIALLLAAVMCLSLAACGDTAEPGNTPDSGDTAQQQDPAQPSTPTESSEPQQEPAQPSTPAESSELDPTPEPTPEPTPAAIELTAENFTEYFELVEILDVPTNEFGEVDKEQFVQIDTVFVLKPEYQEKFVDERDYRSSGAIEWVYRDYYREGVFDYNSNSYTLGRELTETDEISFRNPEEKTDMDEFKLYNADSDIRVGRLVFVQIKDGTIPWNNDYCDIEEFKEILRVQGTLYLYE